MAYRHNAVEVAVADKGVIGLKIFADAAYYRKASQFSDHADHVYHRVGSSRRPKLGHTIRKMPSRLAAVSNASTSRARACQSIL
jgi:hypothetical protein